MEHDVFDFMKIWTQGDRDSEHKIKDVLLDGLDSVIQAESDVLSRIRVDSPTFGPVIRWMKELWYQSRISAQVTGAMRWMNALDITETSSLLFNLGNDTLNHTGPNVEDFNHRAISNNLNLSEFDSKG